MKIVDNTKIVQFENIAIGDSFRVDKYLFIRIYEVLRKGGVRVNAICLSDGGHRDFSYDHAVEVVDVEITIKN